MSCKVLLDQPDSDDSFLPTKNTVEFGEEAHLAITRDACLNPNLPYILRAQVPCHLFPRLAFCCLCWHFLVYFLPRKIALPTSSLKSLANFTYHNDFLSLIIKWGVLGPRLFTKDSQEVPLTKRLLHSVLCSRTAGSTDVPAPPPRKALLAVLLDAKHTAESGTC